MQRRSLFVSAVSIDTLEARQVKRRRLPPFVIASLQAHRLEDPRPCIYAREPTSVPPGWLEGPGRGREGIATRGVRIAEMS